MGLEYREGNAEKKYENKQRLETTIQISITQKR